MSQTTPSDRSAEPVGVLIVRVWTEPSADPPLRARVTRSLDVDGPLSEVSTSSDVDEICDTVRQWLDEFCARHMRRPRGDA